MDLDPLSFLWSRNGGQERPQPSNTARYTPEEATLRDRVNSAMVSYMYLHWLQTGASRHVSARAFALAVDRGELLGDLPVAIDREEAEARISTLPSALPSAPDERG